MKFRLPFVSRRTFDRETARYQRAEGHRLQLVDTLKIALNLVCRHHEPSFQNFSHNGYCPICHRKDGTEPEHDQIKSVLAEAGPLDVAYQDRLRIALRELYLDVLEYNTKNHMRAANNNRAMQLAREALDFI